MTPAGPTPPDKRAAPGDGRQPPSGSGVPGEAGSDAGLPRGPATASGRAGRPQRKSVLLRLDPAVHDALARWAGDDLRSVNAQIEMLLRRALDDAGRLPRDVRPPRRPGRPPRSS